MSMKLYVARHGYAGLPSRDPQIERDRPLLPEGIAMVKAVAKAWDLIDKPPKVIFCSPFTRTMMTADIYGKFFGVQVNVIGDLAPMRPLNSTILDLLQAGLVKRCLLVGHVDNTTPVMRDFGGDVDWDKLVMAEVRRVSMKRNSGAWKLRWAIKPSDLGLRDVKS